jgi:hypothetical protein
VAKDAARGERLGVLGAQNPLVYRHQRSELGVRRGRIPGPPGPVGQLAASSERVRVLLTEHAFDFRYQCGELVPGRGRLL